MRRVARDHMWWLGYWWYVYSRVTFFPQVAFRPEGARNLETARISEKLQEFVDRKSSDIAGSLVLLLVLSL